MRKKLKAACKNLSKQEKIQLYIDALREHNVKQNVKHGIKQQATKVARSVIKRIKRGKKKSA